MTDDLDTRLRSRLLVLAEAATREGSMPVGVISARRRIRPRMALPGGAAAVAAVILLVVVAMLPRNSVQPGLGPTTSQELSPSATSPSPSPVVICGDMAVSDCDASTSAVEAAVAGRNGRVVRVELARGKFCWTPALLFSGAICPAMLPPGGGQWIGSAVVTFVDSPVQAYLNIARNGATVQAAFIALATPPPTAAPASLDVRVVRVRPPTPSGIVIAPRLDGRHYMIRVASTDGQVLATWEIYEQGPSIRSFAAGAYDVSVWYVTVVDNVDTGDRITSPPLGVCSTGVTLGSGTTINVVATFGLGSPTCTLEAPGVTGP